MQPLHEFPGLDIGPKPYGVFYSINPVHRATPEAVQVDRKELAFLGTMMATDPENAFHLMQAEAWNLDGSGGCHVVEAGADHVSMTVGDVLYDLTRKCYLRCNREGFQTVIVR